MLRDLIRELGRKLSGKPSRKPGADASAKSGGQRFLAPDAAAEAALRQRVEHEPDGAEALHALGVLAQLRGDARRAIECYEAALAQKPGVGRWLSNCGEAYRVVGEIDRAIERCREAVSAAPHMADAHLNLGVALIEAQRLDDAARALAEAVRLDAEEPAAHVALATLYFLRGDFERAWPEYAWRRKVQSYRAAARDLPQPAWTGDASPDATVLLYAEQGYGDAIQFVRYAALAAARCKRVLLKVFPELEPVVASVCGPRVELVREGERIVCDAHASLLDLPALLGTSGPADVPGKTPYLAAPSERVAAWRRELASETRLRVGVTWAGRRQHTNDANRSCTVDDFAALSAVEGAAFYAIQKEGGEAVREWPRDARSPLEALPPLGDFGDTAGLIENLDLVISVDTSVAHLAGALAKPVWTLLPRAPDWRWMIDRSDSPWYPTMRLFRQSAARDWSGVVQSVRAALEIEVARHGR